MIDKFLERFSRELREVGISRELEEHFLGERGLLAKLQSRLRHEGDSEASALRIS